MRRFDGRSLLAIGTADPHFDPGFLAEWSASGRRTVTIAGADHSMDPSGDIPASIQAIERVMRELAAFIAT